MCGICGVVAIDGPPPDRDLVTRMIGRLHHRGPDGSGLYVDDRAALGHTRLAIIDTEGGAQPLCNEDQTVWITFNGEIFNYVELGDELRRRGHRFRTHSDTEVIVHAWEEWGEGCFDRFNGQWALALWDSREQRLVLSRDRLGVRPLFFTRDEHRLAFASEVKALMADPELPRELDPVGLDQVLTYWSTVAPRTVFKGIEQLEPGHVAVLDRDGFRRRPYWSADFPARGAEPGQDIEENARELRERIVEAARLRFLRSDVPVGAYLSGGIDSSITAAVIARYTDAPLHTFSLRFADAEYDEGVHQQKMVAELGAQHEDITVSPADVAEVFPDVVLHTETPILRTAPAPLFLLSKLVRQNGYKVVVTGEGADEVLAGYDIFREGRVRAFWARDPGSKTRDRAVELLYPWMANNPGQAPAFARSFFGQDLDPHDPAISHRPRWASTSAVKGMLAPGLLDEVVRGAGDDVLAMLPPQSASWDPLSRAQWLEMTTLLPGYILSSQGDRMLMANSVEGRFPFLDKDVIAFANQLPARHKLCGLDEKHLLKLAFEDLVPESIRRRPKQPYRAPDTASFFSDAPPDWLGDVTSPAALADAGVFAPKLVQGLMAKATRTRGRRTGNTDNMRLLAVISTQLLHQQLIVDGGSACDTAPPQPMTVIDRVQPVRSTA
ncbi:asparagine synthase (glutamine-hydrolyzing) [Nocardioides sp. BE266]|uniref:asparagine synthase (glutamine-hydrolyzing) n=1 Tax=Nocardioides sp. BE266 TaxID=2817725 RepID=UPI0028593C8E|nr:asparagine synthase (glutamine-hydrolyzing) [Nocardioides sp. BE266]MDR7252417.1 asparagine synthase (glutamine-hydrolyzing) [Nocardioides sp. BE266]